MQERYFPIGIQTFEKLRELNAIYVDKTDQVYRLATTGKYFFLARPRRFGKSLLISTFKAYFEGRKDLFDGLAIASLEKDWQQFPVLHLSLSKKRIVKTEDVGILLDSVLRDLESIYGADPNTDKFQYGLRMADLVTRAHAQTGKDVVILIDEYDAPLLDTMHDQTLFVAVRQQMRDFFSPIKDLDGKLRFVFITGISKFSQLSIFSELNNLTTITMENEYAAICGITREELSEQLRPEIKNLALAMGIQESTALARLKRKYDGYHFSKKSPDIYNPLSLLKCLREKEFNNYWFETGTPTHVTEIISQYVLRPEELEGFAAGEMDFNIAFENAETPIPMLYQSGYLTIKKFDGYDYILGFPNEEVRVSFIRGLATYYTKKTATENNSVILKTLRYVRNHDIDNALILFRSFFSSIPYDAEKQDENRYKTIFYLIFTLASDYTVRTEQRSAAGRCDALIETEDTIYLFEFKLDGTAEEALKQIDDKGYAIQYEASEKKVVKIGVNFDKNKRTIERWVIAGAS
ncbi:MAG: ATP-binding protein [Proteobacteria bacterium]|nr:ATP-binding protein [Pseudomonadota bacterium]